MENDVLRLDIFEVLYSIRNGDKFINYKNLKNRLGYAEDHILISELFSLSKLQLIHIQNGLTRFLDGNDCFGIMSITVEGEEYFKKSLKWKKKHQLVKPILKL